MGPGKNSVSIEDLQTLFEQLANQRPWIKEKPTTTIYGSYLLACDDWAFSFWYRSGDSVRCICTFEQEQQITARAKKLGIYKN